MKIGIFDSGLGGLLITRALIKALPQYDYLYLGDTARVPYGNRSQEAIYLFTQQAVDYLFKQDCQLIILACNTASAEALRRIQQEYLPDNYPERRVLGVLIPAAEEAVRISQTGRIGVLATESTVRSRAFEREVHKLLSEAAITQVAAPLLVPLIENDGLLWVGPILKSYLAGFTDSNIDTLILGCTHYPVLKEIIAGQVGPGVKLVSQDEIIPGKLADYLRRHPEIEQKLSKKGERSFLVSDLTASFQELAEQLFQTKILLKQSNYF